MIYIALPDNKKRPLPFYLAMEEYVARHVDSPECFFMWQVEPTVIFGRNQLIDTEVNVDYCRKHHINMFRRKSGGGCVYADYSNIMFSYITSEETVTYTYHRYVNMVVGALIKMGIPAESSGRNDILIEGRKVSGNAFYHTFGRSVVHGTMLYDTDMEQMMKAITPDHDKLQSKGVSSVSQHITTLKEHTKLSIDEFKRSVRATLCDETYSLSASEVSEIEKNMQEYLSDEFIYGKNPKYTISIKKRFEGVGVIEIKLELKNLIIKNINMIGDFLIIGDVDDYILRRLKGTPLKRESLEAALPARLDNVVLNLQKEDFINMLLQSN